MKLRVLHAEIDARVGSIVSSSDDWPCRRGCDDCCRSLSEPPRFGREEWLLLRPAIAALPSEVRELVKARSVALVEGQRCTCPLLDRDEGACLVYDARPVACRTYGFYTARDGGLWCDRIEERRPFSLETGLVAGNQDAVERDLLQASGEPRSLVAWIAEDAL